MKGIEYRVVSVDASGQIPTKGAMKAVFENAGDELAMIGPDDGSVPQLPIPVALEENFNPNRPLDAGEGEYVINQNWKVQFAGGGSAPRLLVTLGFAVDLSAQAEQELSEVTPANV